MFAGLSLNELFLDPPQNTSLTTERNQLDCVINTHPAKSAVLMIQHHLSAFPDKGHKDRSEGDGIPICFIELFTNVR